MMVTCLAVGGDALVEATEEEREGSEPSEEEIEE